MSRCCCRRSLSCRRSRFCFCGRRFATRLPCQARCAVLSLRAGILRPSARFARCASLARRLAALTAVCLAAAPVPGFGTVALPPPSSTLAGAARPARLRLRRRASARFTGIRWRERRLAPLAPSGTRSVAATAPRRLASRADFPGVGYPGSGPLDSLRWPDSHTGRTSDAQCNSTTPGLPLTTLEPTLDVSCLTKRRPLPKKPLRIERVLHSIAIECIDLTGLVSGARCSGGSSQRLRNSSGDRGNALTMLHSTAPIPDVATPDQASGRSTL